MSWALRPKRFARRSLDRLLYLADERRRLDDRTSPALKVAQRSLFLDYRRRALEGQPLPSVWETGFRVFSQFDEDGLILFLLAVLGTGTRRFVDLGAGDGTHASNCANLALNLGFDGLFVDAKEPEAERGRRFYAAHPDTRERPPPFVQAFLTRENVNEVVSTAGFEGEVDLLSVDVDGNDYWLWEALEAVRPRLVVIESHTELGFEDHVMPYDPDFDARSAPPGMRIGASPAALVRLGTELGYRLVGSNLYGFNLLFARSDLGGEAVPTVGLVDLFRHGSYRPGAPLRPSEQRR
jgi:hypothetical protein